MPRRLKIREAKYRVYLEDESIPLLDDEGNPRIDSKTKRPRVYEGCKAVELPVDASIPLPEGVEGATIYTLSSVPLNAAMARSQSAAKGKMGEALYDTVKQGIVGWENVVDAEGGPVPFSTEHVDLMPFEEASAIATFLMEKMSGGSEDARKNG